MAPKNDNYKHNLYYTQHKWLPHFFYGATVPLMKEIQEQKGQLREYKVNIIINIIKALY